jgi:hypothetical protein
MLKMNLITQEELRYTIPRELNRELWMEVRRQLGFPILTDFRGYNTVCYK